MRGKFGSKRLCGVTVGILSGLVSVTAWSSGFQLEEQSASGLGVAFSGMAAATQDASTVYWNPAGMSAVPGMAVAVSADYIDPSIGFRSSGSTYDALGNGGDAGVSEVLPAVYFKMKMRALPSLDVGLAVNVPFGLATNWEPEWAGEFYGVKSRVEDLNINPAVSYKLNDWLSLAGGMSYQRLRATFTQGAYPLVPAAQGRLDGSDWAWSWNVGFLVDLGEGTRIGGTYRSFTDFNLDGTLGFNSDLLAAEASGARSSLRLPQTASIAISQQIVPGLRLLADYTWTGWESIQSLQVYSDSGLTNGSEVLDDQLKFGNSWRAGVGCEYQLLPYLLLRWGFAYDRSPVQDAYRTPRLPDGDRKWLAGGARYSPSSHLDIDVGYAYLWVSSGISELQPNTTGSGGLFGNYDSKASIYGVQASYKF